MNAPRGYVIGVSLFAGLGTLVGGAWSLAAPRSFAGFVNLPIGALPIGALLIGALLIGIATTLLLALLWSDALATALAGFLAGNTLHAVSRAIDPDLGGHAWEPWALAALSAATAAALLIRCRDLGYVVGNVATATTAELAPFVRQKTVLLTTYRKDGTPVAAPVSIAVDGDHAFVRSFEKAGKTKRLRRNPAAELAPSTARGRPTGPAVPVRLHLLDGVESRRAARLLARKHPLLHGVLVPLAHRAMRAKTGRTVHFLLTPAPSPGVASTEADARLTLTDPGAKIAASAPKGRISGPSVPNQ